MSAERPQDREPASPSFGDLGEPPSVQVERIIKARVDEAVLRGLQIIVPLVGNMERALVHRIAALEADLQERSSASHAAKDEVLTYGQQKSFDEGWEPATPRAVDARGSRPARREQQPPQQRSRAAQPPQQRAPQTGASAAAPAAAAAQPLRPPMPKKGATLQEIEEHQRRTIIAENLPGFAEGPVCPKQQRPPQRQQSRRRQSSRSSAAPMEALQRTSCLDALSVSIAPCLPVRRRPPGRRPEHASEGAAPAKGPEVENRLPLDVALDYALEDDEKQEKDLTEDACGSTRSSDNGSQSQGLFAKVAADRRSFKNAAELQGPSRMADRRFSEPDPSSMLRMQATFEISVEELVHGSPKVKTPPTSSRKFNLGIQSFDFCDTRRLPRKVRELHKFGVSDVGGCFLNLNEAQRKTVLKWVLVVIIAFAVGLTAGGLILSSHNLVHWKLHLMEHWMARQQGWWAFLLWFGYGQGASLIAAMLVTYVEPTAGGSGIPDVKAYLNGNLLPDMLCWRTWFCRVIGLIFVTSSGLFAGTEGPMAHVGAITAAGVALGRNSWFRCELRVLSGLQNHHAKLEFMSLGASIGVAAAFGAPIGGLLFSLEEASSFWTPQLTWRAFLGGCIASLVAKAAKTGFSQLTIQGFIEFPDEDTEWMLWELIPFVVMGILLGLIGALFCECVRRMQQLRAKLFRLGQKGKVRKRCRIAEALVVTAITMTVTYALAWGVPCTKDDGDGRRLAGSHDGEEGFPLFSAHCAEPDKEASGIATVLLESREHAIKALFSRDFVHGNFEEAHLALLTVLIFVLTLLTYGCSIPAGLFIPNIMLGACFGRLVGQIMQRLVYPGCHPGIYALMGSTGMLAGFSRMTVSLGVIILEITGDTQLILPIMLVIMSSKLIGDIFTPSAYDIIIALKNIPILEQVDERVGWQEMAKYPASHCGTKLKDMEILHASGSVTVRDALKLLSTTQHNAWPVLESPLSRRLVGLITRQRLLQCLEEGRTLPEPVCSPNAKQCFVWEDPESVARSANTLDLTAYMDTPSVVLERMPLRTAYRTFRSMGLRHLCVINSSHHLVSFITRTDLAEAAEELVRPKVMRLRDFSEAMQRQESDVCSEPESSLAGAMDVEQGDHQALPGSRKWRRMERNNAEVKWELQSTTFTRQFSAPAITGAHSQLSHQDGNRLAKRRSFEAPAILLSETPQHIH